jgi:hypothetical protein
VTHLRNLSFIALCFVAVLTAQPGEARALCNIDEPSLACMVGLYGDSGGYCTLDGECTDTTDCFEVLVEVEDYCQERVEEVEGTISEVWGFICFEPLEPPTPFFGICECVDCPWEARSK